MTTTATLTNDLRRGERRVAARRTTPAAGGKYACRVVWARRGALGTVDDAMSFETRFSQLLPFAYNVGYRFFGGNATLAEDVAQESLTRAFVAWQRVQDHPNLEAWVTTTALHVALELSRQQRRAGWPEAAPLVTDVPGEEHRVADIDLVAHALGKLSTRQQQVVMWRFYFDQSVHETAERLGLTDSKVKDATHEAMTKLSRLLGSAKEVLR